MKTTSSNQWLPDPTKIAAGMAEFAKSVRLLGLIKSITTTSLNGGKNGALVAITVKKAITKQECVDLIERYKPRAAPYGQVAIHMPVPEGRALAGEVLPWGVFNFKSGVASKAGLNFNDSLLE
ncbi:hypothetical protein MXMO3_01817 [Maritalea myrionectae]|uniref:Uncharacterized protein n=2 Tax=Maritalea myrionectae TaxID=454601 RepID=A0A2R4MEA7_9HYPH|nr:hypothetical protein MXMO3_01817 [Maritalea myrionectae]